MVVYYDSRFDGEQLSLMGEQIFMDDSIIPYEVVSEGIVRASNATDGAVLLRLDGSVIMNLEVYAPGTGDWLEIWHPQREVVVDLPFYDFSEDVLRSAIRKALVALATGSLETEV